MKTSQSRVRVTLLAALAAGLGAMSSVGCTAGPTSLNGIALVADPHQKSRGFSKDVGFLTNGEGVPFEAGAVISYAPIQLPHGATIQGIRCVVRDNAAAGHLLVQLVRGSIATGSSSSSSDTIASISTEGLASNPDFQELSVDAREDVAEVDNANYGYFLRVDFVNAPAPSGPSPALSVRGCIVEH